MSAGIEPAPKGLTGKVVSGAGWSTLSTAVRQILSIACVGLLAHLLGPDAYGLMAMSNIVMVFLLNFRDLGTASAVIQRQQVSEALLSSLFWVNCAVGALLSVVVFASARPAAEFFHEPRLTNLLETLSASFFITSAGVVHNSLLTRNMSFRRIALVDVASAAGGYAVAIPCAFAGLGVWSLVLANLTNSIVATAGYWLAANWTPRFRFAMAEIRAVTAFSLNLSGFGLVNYFARNADNIVVGRYLGKAALGIYQMAYALMLYPIQNISSILGQVSLPAFSRIQADNERFRDAYIRSSMLIALVTFPVITGMAAVADPLVRAVLGEPWVGVIPLFQILAPVGMVQSLQTMVGQIYVAKGRTDWMFRWSLGATLVLVTCFVIGVRYGVNAVAIAYGAGYLGVLMYPGFRIPFRLIGLDLGDYARALWPQFWISVAMACACAGWLFLMGVVNVANPWARLVSTSLLGAAFYIWMMVKIRPPVVLCLEEVMAQSGFNKTRKYLRAAGLFPAGKPV